MAAFATVGDIESRWRPLTEPEANVALAWLDTASAIVRQRIRGIDAMLADEDFLEVYPDYENLVTGVVAAMVLRVLRNPDGYRQATVGDASFTRDDVVSAGLLYLSEDDAALLADPRTPSTAFTIRAAANPGYRLDAPTLDWS